MCGLGLDKVIRDGTVSQASWHREAITIHWPKRARIRSEAWNLERSYNEQVTSGRCSLGPHAVIYSQFRMACQGGSRRGSIPRSLLSCLRKLLLVLPIGKSLPDPIGAFHRRQPPGREAEWRRSWRCQREESGTTVASLKIFSLVVECRHTAHSNLNTHSN